MPVFHHFFHAKKAFVGNIAPVGEHPVLLVHALRAVLFIVIKSVEIFVILEVAGNFENVGYALPGKACIYNILIMEEMQTIVACGAGTTTKVVFPAENRRERCENVKEVEQYISRIDEMIGRKERILV